MIPSTILPSHRRLIVLAGTIFLISSVYLCTTRLFAISFTRTGSSHHPEKEQKNFKLTDADLPMSYGNFDRPPIDGLPPLLQHLPEELVPTVENKRRLVVVGDIHGMDMALDALLTKIEFNTTTDHLIATGDMIHKGPESAEVVDRLMRLNASAVRGNHDDRILLTRAEIDSQSGVSAELDNIEAQDRKGVLADLATARLLSTEQVDWLARLPLILCIESLRIRVVHAGLVPGVEMESQDPWAVMNMRTLTYPREAIREKEGEQPLRRRNGEAEATETADALSQYGQETATVDEPTTNTDTIDKEGDVHAPPISFDRAVVVPSKHRDGEAWSVAWSRHQKRLPKEERYTIIYGHDARSGYKETEYTFGLDSNCVKGGALTALIITAKEGGGFKHLMSQVTCQKA
jgi:bis(5'-nucleosyl)-tetraphosphatase (symmetrical)